MPSNVEHSQQTEVSINTIPYYKNDAMRIGRLHRADPTAPSSAVDIARNHYQRASNVQQNSSNSSGRQNLTSLQSNTNSVQNCQTASDTVVNREEKKLLLFILLFSINIFAIIALLILWNIKGISNQNVTWALLAVCCLAAFSVFCCVLYFVICVDKYCGNSTHRSAFCAINVSSRKYNARKFFRNISISKLKRGFGRKNNIYSVQTVYPTPEFKYFGNSPPTTLSRSKLDRIKSSSKDSQLSDIAFSARSTAPASSMLDITEMYDDRTNRTPTNFSSPTYATAEINSIAEIQRNESGQLVNFSTSTANQICYQNEERSANEIRENSAANRCQNINTTNNKNFVMHSPNVDNSHTISIDRYLNRRSGSEAIHNVVVNSNFINTSYGGFVNAALSLDTEEFEYVEIPDTNGYTEIVERKIELVSPVSVFSSYRPETNKIYVKC